MTSIIPRNAARAFACELTIIEPGPADPGDGSAAEPKVEGVDGRVGGHAGLLAGMEESSDSQAELLLI